jgi:hypothetical protein
MASFLLEVDELCSGSCPMLGFIISVVETLGSATTVLVNFKTDCIIYNQYCSIYCKAVFSWLYICLLTV